jgi:hypothetical protein
MLNYTRLHAVFPSEGAVPYDQRGTQEIETLRRTLDGVLFVDRVLKALGIGEGKEGPSCVSQTPSLIIGTFRQSLPS